MHVWWTCLSGGGAADLQGAGHTTYEGVVGREIETKDARLVAEATSGDGRSGTQPGGAETYLRRLEAIRSPIRGARGKDSPLKESLSKVHSPSSEQDPYSCEHCP